MKSVMTAFIAGLVFSFGLVLGGMTIPNNIIGFLDITGNWKPALAFVMMGAIAVYFVSFRLILRRKKPLFTNEFHFPKMTTITPSLIIGSAIFGIGWALSGFCPGPAIVSTGAGEKEAILFTICMLIGMLFHQFLKKVPSLNEENRQSRFDKKPPTT